MVTAFIIDFPILILVGLVFSYFKCDIERDDPFYRFASFWWGLGAFSMLVGFAIFSYQLWPGWMWLYYLEPSVAKGLISTKLGWLCVIFLLYFMPYVMGYVIGSHGRQQSRFVIFNTVIVIVLAQYFIFTEFSDRLFVIREEVSSLFPNGTPLFESVTYKKFFLATTSSLVSYTLICGWIARMYYLRALESGKIVLHLLHPGKRRTLQKIAEAILPEALDLRKISAKDMPIAEMVSREFADFNFPNRFVIRMSVEFINTAPIFYYGIPFRFEFLSQKRQVELLQKMDDSNSLLVKVPLTLIRMFMYQMYYQDQRVLDELGYVGDTFGKYRPYLRWLNVPEFTAVTARVATKSSPPRAKKKATKPKPKTKKVSVTKSKANKSAIKKKAK